MENPHNYWSRCVSDSLAPRKNEPLFVFLKSDFIAHGRGQYNITLQAFLADYIQAIVIPCLCSHVTLLDVLNAFDR